MADPNSSAAVQALSSQSIKLETLELPGFTGGKTGFDPLKYKVKYAKIDLDDVASRAELEILETKGLTGTDIVVLSKSSFTFMDKYFIIITYLEFDKPV